MLEDIMMSALHHSPGHPEVARQRLRLHISHLRHLLLSQTAYRKKSVTNHHHSTYRKKSVAFVPSFRIFLSVVVLVLAHSPRLKVAEMRCLLVFHAGCTL